MSAPLERLLARGVMPIVDAIGYDLAIKLVSRLGGTRIHLAASVHPRDELAQVIGLEAARCLVQQLGRGVVDLPRCQAWLMARRNEEIVNRWDAGETQRELALRFNLTERHVRNVIALSERAERQAPSTLAAAEAGRGTAAPCRHTAGLFGPAQTQPDTEGATK